MKIRPTFIIVLCLGLIFSQSIAQQKEMHITLPGDSSEMGYLLYLPEGYSSSETLWPLVLFLHGSGENGNNLQKVKVNGPPKLIDQGKQYPFIMVSPQCPEGERWSVKKLSALLYHMEKELHVDTNRIYVTGLSMGGQGTWNLAMAYPGRFAAIVPVCGRTDTTRAGNLKGLPVWAFHGAKDDVVPVSNTLDMVRLLKAMGNPVKVTIYPNAGHDAWTEAYNNKKLYRWLLKQHR